MSLGTIGACTDFRLRKFPPDGFRFNRMIGISSSDRLMMQMVGSFADFERAMIKERTQAGLDAAWQEGRIGGRPKLRHDQRQDIADIVLSGRKTGAQMARLYGISLATVSRIVAGRQSSETSSA